MSSMEIKLFNIPVVLSMVIFLSACGDESGLNANITASSLDLSIHNINHKIKLREPIA